MQSKVSGPTGRVRAGGGRGGSSWAGGGGRGGRPRPAVGDGFGLTGDFGTAAFSISRKMKLKRAGGHMTGGTVCSGRRLTLAFRSSEVGAGLQEPRASSMECPACGHVSSEDAPKFCSECGERMPPAGALPGKAGGRSAAVRRTGQTCVPATAGGHSVPGLQAASWRDGGSVGVLGMAAPGFVKGCFVSHLGLGVPLAR